MERIITGSYSLENFHQLSTITNYAFYGVFRRSNLYPIRISFRVGGVSIYSVRWRYYKSYTFNKLYGDNILNIKTQVYMLYYA